MADRDLDAPRPPGGPQRDDAPAPGAHHGGDEPERHPGRADTDHDGEGDGEGDGDREVRHHAPARDLQEENAETSLDQPSQ